MNNGSGLAAQAWDQVVEADGLGVGILRTCSGRQKRELCVDRDGVNGTDCGSQGIGQEGPVGVEVTVRRKKSEMDIAR
jgi:hypothetical protein